MLHKSIIRYTVFIMILLLGLLAWHFMWSTSVFAAPTAPTGVSFAENNVSATISWTKPAGATSHRIYVDNVQVATGIANPPYTLDTSTWRWNKLYKVEVSAVDGTGEGAKSSFVLAYRPTSSETRSMDASNEFSVAVHRDGGVSIWGRGSNNTSPYPAFHEGVTPITLNNVIDVSASTSNFIVALKRNGTVECWGAATTAGAACAVPVGLTNVVQVAAAGTHVLALKADGTITGWGTNGSGVLTIPGTATNVRYIDTNTNHALALKSDGTVVAWGSNASGQTTVPTGLTNVISITTTLNNSYALLSGGTVTAWGATASSMTTMPVTAVNLVDIYGSDNASWLIGLKSDGTMINIRNGYALTATTNSSVIKLSAGFDHFLALKSDGSMVGVTGNTGGAQNHNLYKQADFPGWTTNLVDVSIGDFLGTALKGDGTVVQWGYNDPNNRQATVPSDLSNVRKISTGHYHTLALKNDGTVVAWGSNNLGQRTLPVGIETKTIVDISAGHYFSMALASDGTVFAWGDNTGKQLNIPVGLTDVIDIEAGPSHALALKADGSVVAWGQYWNNGYVDFPQPPIMNNVVKIATANSFAIALREDGTIVPWGGDTATWSIETSTQFYDWLKKRSYKIVDISASYRTVSLLRADGTVDIWSNDVRGTTPLTNRGAQNSSGTGWVSQDGNVPGLANVIKLTGGVGETSTAIRSDGSIISWTYYYLYMTAATQSGERKSLLPPVASITAGDGQVALNWSASAGATSYNVYIRGVKHNVSPIIGTSYTITGLTNNRLLGDVQVTAVNATTESMRGTPLGAFPRDKTGPSVPANVAVVASSPTRISLTWDASTDAGVGGIKYEVFVNGTLRDTVSTNSYILGGLTANTAYSIRVLAKDWWSNRSVQSVAISVTTPSHVTSLPSTPSTPTFGVNGSNQAVVSWSAVAGASSYSVYVDNTMVASGVTETSFALNTSEWLLTKLYKVEISASNNQSEGNKSNLVFAYKPTPINFEIRQIKAGPEASIYLRRNGTVTGLGGNSSLIHNPPDPNNSNIIAIDAGTDFAVALRADGTVIAWGSNTHGQRTVPVGLNNVVAIAAGSWHALALKADGTVVAWGRNTQGTTPTANVNNAVTLNATAVPEGLNNVMAIAAGGSFSMALKSDGSVVVWGKHYSNSTPVGWRDFSIPAMTDVKLIGATALTAMAVRADGTLVQWGDSTYTQLHTPGDGNDFVQLDGADDWMGTSIGLRSDGRVVTWGAYSSRIILPVGGVTDAVQVAAGKEFGIALRSNGSIIGWGRSHSFNEFNFPGWQSDIRQVAVGGRMTIVKKSDNTYAYWGENPIAWNWSPILPSNVHSAVRVYAGYFNHAYLNSNGSLTIFGNNQYNQRSVPSYVSNVVDVSIGERHVSVLMANGTVVSFGDSSLGQMNVPTGLSNVVSVSAGTYYTLALKANGTVVGWGDNSSGQISNLSGLNNIVQISAGSHHALALRADGTVSAWGRNNNNESSVPENLTDVVQVYAGNSVSMALRKNGTIVAWGWTAYGLQTIPVALAGNFASLHLSSTSGHVIAHMRDGTILGWGQNDVSQRNNFNIATNALLIPYPSITAGDSSAMLTWDAVPGATKYNVYINGTKVNTLDITTNSYTITGLTNYRVYPYITVTAATNSFETAHSMRLQVMPTDQTPPTLASNVAASTIGSNSFKITWTASSDSGIGMNEYEVFLNGIKVGMTTATSYTFTGLTANTSYTVALKAVDLVGNKTAFTSNLTVTTQPVQLPLPAPTNVVFDFNGNLPRVSWNSIVNATSYSIYVNNRLFASEVNATNYTFNTANTWKVRSLYRVNIVANKNSDEGTRSANVYVYRKSPTNTRAIAATTFTMAIDANGFLTAWGAQSNSVLNIPANIGTVIDVQVANNHAVALRTDGTVVAWGLNSSGQASVPAGLSDVIEISSKFQHTLALKADGTVVAWGSGTTNTGTNSNFGQSIIPIDLNNVISVSAGAYHSLALLFDGTMVAWGAGTTYTGISAHFGQSIIPAGLNNVKAIAAGPMHSLALKTDGTVFAWGRNDSQQINIPPSVNNAVAIDAGRMSGHNVSIALLNDGRVINWGWNASTISIPAASNTNFIDIFAGSDNSFALQTNGTVFSMGSSNSSNQRYFPGWASNIRQVATGGTTTVIVRENGTLGVWGSNNSSSTNNLHLVTNAVKAVVTNNNIAILRADRTVSVFGSTSNTIQTIPAGLNDATDISIGEWHVLALRAGGTVSAWGAGTTNTGTNPSYGQSIVPAGLTSVIKVSAGQFHSLALRSNGTVVAWGAGATNTATNNHFGQSIVPAGLTNVIDIAAGALHSLALKADGTVLCWGNNTDGRCTIPAGLNDVISISAGSNFSAALKRDGTLVTWPTVNATIPTAMQNNIARIDFGSTGAHFGVVKMNRTIWMAGSNTVGQANNFPGLPATLSTPQVNVQPSDRHAIVSWGAISGATTYNVYVNGNKLNSEDIVDTEYRIFGLTNGQLFTGISVTAANATNESLPSINFSVVPIDNLGPSQPNGLTALNITKSAFNLFWNPSFDYTGVTGYEIYRDNVLIGTSTQTNFNITGLSEFFVYDFKIVSIDAAGNKSSDSLVLAVRTADQTSPTVPSDLVEVNKSDVTIKISWVGSTDNIGIKEYEVYSNGVLIAPTTQLEMVIDSLSPSTSYTFTVRAVDTSGNKSAHSSPILISTLAAPSSSVTFAIVNNQAVLNWQVVPGASYYKVYVNDGLVGNNITTTTLNLVTTTWKVDKVYVVKVSAINGGVEGAKSAPALAYKPTSQVIRSVSGGGDFSLIVNNDGTVGTIGRNQFNQLITPANLNDAIVVAAGEGHGLALRKDGTVVAWGKNNFGQATVPADLNQVVAIAAGSNHSLALKGNGTVVAWGLNSFGQSNVNPNLRDVIAIAAGGSHSLALKEDGTVVAWGNNSLGQSTVPGGLTSVIEIAAGTNHSLALRSDGTVVAWGANDSGQISVPAGLTNVTAIDGDLENGNFSVALLANGTAVAWGDNSFGQSTVPDDLTGITSLSAGLNHVIALKSNGTIVGWGNNTYGQSTFLGMLTNIVTAGTGSGHTLAVNNNGNVIAWGYNNVGQIDVPIGLTNVKKIVASANQTLVLMKDGTIDDWGVTNNAPSNAENIIDISAGAHHFLALKSDGSVIAWGDNGYGQADVPSGLKDVVAVAAGVYHSLALRSNGTVVGWGRNTSSEINIPINLESVVAISAGQVHSLALKADGTMVGWGSNSDGQLNIPVGLNEVISVKAGSYHSLVLKKDGTILAWGRNTNGQASVPTSAVNVVQIHTANTSNHNVALLGNGTMIAWGQNQYGQAKVNNGAANLISAPLVSLSVTDNQTYLSWPAVPNATFYDIYANELKHNTSPITSTSNYHISNLLANQVNINIYVVARNLTNSSIPSAALSNIVYDTEPPTSVTGITAGSIAGTSLSLSWNTSSDNTGILEYVVYLNNEFLGTSKTNTYVVTGLASYTNYDFKIAARDLGKNLSALSATVSVRTKDIFPPTAPIGLNAGSITSYTFTLFWLESTDEGSGIGQYIIYRDGEQIGTTTNTSYNLSGLSLGSQYLMTVRAVDKEGNQSNLTNILPVNTLIDVTPPGLPGKPSLVPGTVTSRTYTLTWTEAYDNTGIQAYEVYRDDVLQATVSSNSYAASGLIPNTIYSWTVKAIDTVSLKSDLSQIGSIRTALDSTPPSVTEFIEVTNKKDVSLTLNWDAATDDSSIARYEIFSISGTSTLNYLLIGQSTTLSYNVLNLRPGTVYRYSVRAVDIAGNKSGHSRILRLLISDDMIPPSIPANLLASNKTASSFTLSWDHASDNIVVAGYEIYLNGTYLSTTIHNTLQLTKLLPDTEYELKIVAYDAYKNKSMLSEPLLTTTLKDEIPPTAPTGIVVSKIAANGFNVKWNASTDNVAVMEYELYINGNFASPKISGLQHTFINLLPTTSYEITLKAIDTSNNASSFSTSTSVTTISDLIAPRKPTGLQATDITISSFTLNWLATTDNLTVKHYEVYHGAKLLTTTNDLSFEMTDLTINTQYPMKILAVDEAGNRSSFSNLLYVRTLKLVIPPAKPTGLILGSAFATELYLSWGLPTDAIAVSGYDVFVNGVLLTRVKDRKANLKELVPSTEYDVTIKAFDNDGERSVFSDELTVSTIADTVIPSIPSSLKSTSLNGLNYLISWGASTDNYQIDKYRIYVNGVQHGTSTTNFYQLNALQANLLYQITVKAEDKSGNLSPSSLTVAVHTALSGSIIAPVFSLESRPEIAKQFITSSIVLGSNATIGVKVIDVNNQLVRTLQANVARGIGKFTMPWKGEDNNFSRVPDGQYNVTMSATDSGNFRRLITNAVLLDNVLPIITNLSVSNHLDSEAGLTSTQISFTVSEYSRITINLVNSRGAVVYGIVRGQFYEAGSYNIQWNGKDLYGQPMADDAYKVVVFASDRAQNRSLNVSADLNLEISNPFINSVKWKIGPYKPSMMILNRLSLVISESGTMNIKIFDSTGQLVHTLFNGAHVRGVWGMNWNGRNADGNVLLPGTYTYKVNATDAVGKSATEFSGSITLTP